MNKFALYMLAAALALPIVPMSTPDVMAMDDAKKLKKMIKRGKKVAVKQCFACHDITADKQHRVGPALWGIYGKPAGQIEGYKYSDAHIKAAKEKNIVWNEENLNQYLIDPKSLMPDNKMAYPVSGMKVMSDKQRKNVIEFLKSLK